MSRGLPEAIWGLSIIGIIWGIYKENRALGVGDFEGSYEGHRAIM